MSLVIVEDGLLSDGYYGLKSLCIHMYFITSDIKPGLSLRDLISYSHSTI